MRDHLALTVCFSGETGSSREKEEERKRENARLGPAGDPYVRVHGQTDPFIACIASPIAITSAIWAWNYTHRNRYETIVDSSIKVFDPSFTLSFSISLSFPLLRSLLVLFVRVSVLRSIKLDAEQFVTLSGVRCNLQRRDMRCFSRRRKPFNRYVSMERFWESSPLRSQKIIVGS